jgi:DNA polymerase-1
MPPRGGRKGRLVLIDAHSLIYRAFFALPPMSTSAGEVTNAVYGFTSMLAIVLASRPEYAVAAFDVGGPTFRNEEYAEYKAGRRAMPDDLRPQIQRVRQVLESFSIPLYGVPGFEADDIVGTLAHQGEEMGLQVTIVSGDLDCLQCVTDSVDALVPRRGITDTTIYGPDQVRQRYNLEPSQLIDYKALRGDTSDNIPGVPGVGEKTASLLVAQFGSIENLLANLDQLKPGRVRDALEANADRVRLGKRLVTIRLDVDVHLELERSRWTRYDADAARRLFDELEFRQLLARFPAPDSIQVPVQPTLAFEPVAPAEGVRVVTGRDELDELGGRLRRAEEVGVFGLWDGPARGGRLVGLGLGFADQAYYVPLRHENDAVNLPLDLLLSDVTAGLRGLELLGHDVKEMQLALDGVDPHPYRWGFSSSLAAYLLGAGARDPRLEDLSRDFLGQDLVPTDQLLGTGRSARQPSATDVADAANYTAGRARACFNLRPRLAAEMRNLGVDYLFHEVELPLARVLAGMESEGVAIDVPYLAEVAVDLGAQLAAIEAEVASLAEETGGSTINLNAPQQLAKFLFEDLKLPVGKRIKTGYSTDAETLEALRDRHPIIGRILEHRQLSKLKSTYVDSLPGLVDPRDGRVHTSLNQAATATGRLSSSNPNLMNIPIRTELGQRIRRAFVAGRPGHLLLSADYSQIELRIAAHLSEEPNLLSAFEAGQDIHAATAARVFRVPIESVTPDQRRLAKIANFGSLYGQGEYGLSIQMGIPGDEAREFLKEYWSTYARLREWLDGVRNQAREEGFVVSPTGRRRSIPDLRSPNFQLRAAAERMAINFPIQSLAADIIKIAMVRLDREMEESRLAGKMILQVHDELVFEIPEPESETFAEMVPRVMVTAYELQGGLEVEARLGPNWAEVRKVAALRA